MSRHKERNIYQKIYIQVPYHEKDLAKELGAMWDAKCKSWYIHDHMDVSMFDRWHYSLQSDTVYFTKRNEFYFTRHGNIDFYFTYDKTSWRLNWQEAEKVIDCDSNHWCKYNDRSLDEVVEMKNCANCPKKYIEVIKSSGYASNEHELITRPSNFDDVRKNILHSYVPLVHNHLNNNKYLFRIIHTKWIYKK
jgi:hypothetical protein